MLKVDADDLLIPTNEPVAVYKVFVAVRLLEFDKVTRDIPLVAPESSEEITGLSALGVQESAMC